MKKYISIKNYFGGQSERAYSDFAHAVKKAAKFWTQHNDKAPSSIALGGRCVKGVEYLAVIFGGAGFDGINPDNFVLWSDSKNDVKSVFEGVSPLLRGDFENTI